MSKYIKDESYKIAMGNLNEALEKQKNIQTTFGTLSKQYIEMLKEEIRLLEEQKKLTDDYIKELNKN